MQQKQDDPIIILTDIVNDMNDNKKYLSYKKVEEWEPFFKGLRNLVR